MKFIKLEILNLASLDRERKDGNGEIIGETINFTEGALGDCTIFSIVGPTGSGKSTILDAICLALYSRAPRYPRKKSERGSKIEIFGKKEDGEENRLAPTDPRNILTRGKKVGYSKLTFLANNGDKYRAEWHVRFKQKDFADVVTKLFKITSNVKEEEKRWDDLPRIIGLDYDQFLRTVLIAQGSFATFLTAKEEERYQLLEKLIGCEELYTTIAAKIKQQKDEAVNAYNQIDANFSAQEKDLIAEEELATLKETIEKLKDIEKQSKEELAKVTEALAWYSTNEQHQKNIVQFEQVFNNAKQQKDASTSLAQRLTLHDETLKAVELYREIKVAEGNIAKLRLKLDDFDKSIGRKMQEIKTEEEVNLAQLTRKASEASEELEKQRPHIIKARAIMVELAGLKQSLSEKTTDKDQADKAKKNADNAVTTNATNITQATSALEKAQASREDLIKRLQNDVQPLQQQVEATTATYDQENSLLAGCDAAALQEAKDVAERTKNDLNNAIRIQDELKNKLLTQQQEKDKQKKFSDRNDLITAELKTFNIERLSQELDTLVESFTLISSENWEQHRAKLVDGEACPLCGATHHPYHEAENIAPVVDKMKTLVDDKRYTLKQLQDKERELSNEQSNNRGQLDGIKSNLVRLDKEIETLRQEWSNIHTVYVDWPEDAKALRTIQPAVQKNVDEASKNLQSYNELQNKVVGLLNKKNKAEQMLREFEQTSQEQQQAAEKAVTDLHTTLETERGKTENLKAQQSEKTQALNNAVEAVENAREAVETKTQELKQEIGDKDPNKFEQELENTKVSATHAIESKTNAIALLRQKLDKERGIETATKNQLSDENENCGKKKRLLADWLTDYNNDKEGQPLTEEIVAQLCAANDNWEQIRNNLTRINNDFITARTTLDNEMNASEMHQQNKPALEREELERSKTELEGRSNEELVSNQARLQRHETAKQQMGAMFNQKQDAELQKKEWEEIADAIGGEGKTLRMIAQCYTLRFLIEHANAEIRKFNSRYELQHVKNSLGIRVIDHDRADDVRDTTSLSGGETFIVSLGLALGLSALSSRNISFDNLFIDEGFGTLDPDTLATVIDSLAMLQTSQGKKVGVISHTDTMSERITTQIRIIKDGNSGSSHIEFYPK